MISLTCTNCRTVLTIDDAFAGGVCRCQHCGTIQTVPTHLKGTATRSVGAHVGGAKTQKPVFARDRAAESGVRVGTGLDELAEVVASSGFGSAGSGLRSGRLRTTGAPAPTKSVQKSLALWLSVAGGMIVVLLVVVVWLAMSRSSPHQARAVADAKPTVGSDVAPLATGPHFCGIRLDVPVVIYVIDRGSATADVFDALKEATYKSIESLGADRKFQIIFWSNGQDESYPSGSPAYARTDNVSAARRAMEDITAFGQTDPSNALKRAIANKADAIVIATAKGLDLDPGLVQQTLQIRKTSPARIHAISIGDVDSAVLRDIANKTGGEYKTVTASTLRTFGE